MPRIKPVKAMEYLGISRDSFQNWCDVIQINLYKYEFSNRTYLISGEFYSKADSNEIKRLRELHGDKWYEFYGKYDEVRAFLTDDKEPQLIPIKQYQPKSGQVADFINNLRE